MRLLVEVVSLRHLRLEPLRSALMIFGIALGVAVFVGVRALNETTLYGFDRIFEAASGQADLIVERGPGGMKQDFVQSLRKDPDIKTAAPLLVVHARPAKKAKEPERLLKGRQFLFLGMDFLDPAAAKAYGGSKEDFELPEPGKLALLPNAVLISRELAAREGLKIGDRLAFYGPKGRRPFEVVGFYKGQDMTAGLGGDVLIMSLPSAQFMFQRPGKIDRVVLQLKDKAKLGAVKARVQSMATGLKIREPGQGSERADNLLKSMQVGLSMASLLALLIGQFLIYNTMSTAIVRRRVEIGILRAVGATKRQLAILWFAEALVYGIFGALLGLALGVAAARLSLDFFANNISQLYEAVQLKELRVSPLTLFLGFCSGPFATFLAAILPVREALMVAPVEAARKDLPPSDPRPLVRRLAIMGVFILILSALLVQFFDRGLGLIGGGFFQFALTVGFAFCAPWGVLTMTSLIRPVFSRLFGPSGALAGDNLVKSPIRAGITVAALMVAVGGVLSIACLVFSLKASIRVWLDGVLTADLYISASSPLGAADGTRLDRSFEDKLKALPGVEAIHPVTYNFEDIDGKPSLIIALDGREFGLRSKVAVVDGDIAKARDLMATGEGLVVSDNFARIRGKGLGDTVVITGAKGQKAFKICLVCIDYSSEHGTLFIHRPIYEEVTQDTRVDTYTVWFQDSVPRARRKELADSIRDKYGADYDLFVLDNERFRKTILDTVEDSFRVSYAMEFVAIGIALLGVINTLFAAVLERTREIGVLRAIGAARSHIRVAVVLEALLLGSIAGLFGVTCGLALGTLLVGYVTAGAFGWSIPFIWPWWPSVFGVALAGGLSALAGLIPAERAATVDIVDALAYE